MIAIITVTGNDHPGIIAAVTTGLAELNVNVLDLSQQIMGGYFTMILRVDTANQRISHEATAHKPQECGSITALQEKMTLVGDAQGVLIRVQSEEIFRAVTHI
ncbi:ACT domain-containing protein [Arcanobacterium hippocoleae]|uniref:ACT domain-containing protein n=1 Tax=Arcanobacterium hippocoleae TaxID=149017 RepID=A0ABU1T2Z9_9ACTO|nr:ACT domain-containing protein [Arcanobacterium hippocoleae]MDR6939620.1 ACT domain-containing protein [Arcanobacterium hippocoleae]